MVPSKVILPTLHCPMGLTDKILESWDAWLYMDVLKLGNTDDEAIRDDLKNWKEQFTHWEHTLESRSRDYEENKTNANKILKLEAAGHKNNARKERKKSNDKYKIMVQQIKRRQGSFHSKLETTYRNYNISREHYHGGKFNGVDCSRFMENATEIFEEIRPIMEENKMDSADIVQVREKFDRYANLLGMMDTIWSCVRGKRRGLLPTQEDIDFLTAAVKEGKRRWLELGITTLQPKWHLTFDGHLVDQVSKFQGLADKGDDPIEKGHQVWKIYYDRFCRIVSFKKRERCIRKAWKRARHPAIANEIKAFQNKRKKHGESSKRKRDAKESERVLHDQKRIKREAFLQQQQQDVP